MSQKEPPICGCELETYQTAGGQSDSYSTHRVDTVVYSHGIFSSPRFRDCALPWLCDRARRASVFFGERPGLG
ncbi:MAG: hypothetical protein B6A08_00595 [Sorangiineae bacterium NIC37A_2]|nr:MAG: hypothetical protein B6A08_00595 [Sorangiineae bacterium NIC37A_2]